MSARLYAEGDLDGAARVLKGATAIDPDNAQLHFMLGNALFRQEQYAPSVESFQKAAALRKNHPDTHLNLGFALYHAKRFDEATEAWNEAMRQNPSDGLMRISVALGLQAQGKVAEARKQVLNAVAVEPHWRDRLSIDMRWNREMVQAIENLADARKGDEPSRQPSTGGTTQ